jgi:hypothetical protein
MLSSTVRNAFQGLGAVLTCAALMLSGTSVQGQQASARNVFWSASDLVQVAENPGATPASNPNPPAIPKKKPAKPSQTPSAPHVDTELVAKNGYGQQPQLVRVSSEQIGIRYALLLRDSNGHYSEVSPTTIFHNGDHLRLSVMANQPGFLYVIQQGSTGSWSSIFPGKSSAPASGEAVNQIEQGRIYQIPDGKGSFLFDQNPGQEKLFVILSRRRISDLDSVINSLRNSTQPGAAPSALPAAPETSGTQSETIEALNRIPDAFVQNLASRDLSLVEEEDVDEKSGGDRGGEKAVYVVSKASYSKDGSQRVVANINLHHE